MRWIAGLAAIAVLAGCFQSRTVDCGDGFICPPDQACAAPGYCGAPAQVEKCDGRAEWTACAFPGDGSCHHGICEACDADRQGCGSGWRAMSPPTTADLKDIWVLARDNAYAVGTSGVLLHYDGTAWQNVATDVPLPGDLLSIWGSSDDDYWIVSTSGLVHITNRTTATMQPVPGNLPLAVWGTSATNVYTSGMAGSVEHFDGNTWTEVRTGGFALKFLDGSDDRVYAAGESGSYAYSQSGGAWATGTINTGGTLVEGLFVGNEVLVVGKGRTVMRQNGATWDPGTFDLSVPVGLDLWGVWGSGVDYWAVGSTGKVLRSTDAQAWQDATPTPPLGSSTLAAIDGTSEHNFFVVGAAGTIWQFNDE